MVVNTDWFRDTFALNGHIVPLRRFVRQRRVANERWVRSMCMVAPTGPTTAVCRVLGRYKMYVNSNAIDIGVHLMFDGYWEMWLTEALVEAIEPGMIVADIGANLGYFTLLMADLVGPNGRVAAFEPNDIVVDQLQRSVLANGFGQTVMVSRQPLDADNDRTLFLHVDDERPGGAFVAAHDGASASDMRVQPVLTRRLDSFTEFLDVQVIKIDAEGAEERIWRGMSGLLGRGALKTVFLEWCRDRYADPGAFLDTMTTPGFTLAWLDPENGIRPITRAGLLDKPATWECLLVLRR